jgi:hypothetical protein
MLRCCYLILHKADICYLYSGKDVTTEIFVYLLIYWLSQQVNNVANRLVGEDQPEPLAYQNSHLAINQ